MAIYIILIVSLLLFSFTIKTIAANGEWRGKKIDAENVILKFGIIAIFLILALKKYTVGIDIYGYWQQYELSSLVAWSDVDYVYFEKGYIQLMKLFSKLDVDFKLFMAGVYALLCFSLYLFIKKYSTNVTLSLLTFICYQFFVFSISGVRQTIAMALCMLAYICFDRKKIKYRILAILINVAACYIHKSAIIFFVVYVISLFKSSRIHLSLYVLSLPVSYLLRPTILQFISEQFDTDKTDSVVTLGGAFLFLMAIALLVWFATQNKRSTELDQKNDTFNLSMAARVLLLSIPANIILSGSTFLRATMYLNLFMIPAVPSAINMLPAKQDRLMLNCAIGLFVIIVFYVTTLLPNQLELCPYKFFWQ